MNYGNLGIMILWNKNVFDILSGKGSGNLKITIHSDETIQETEINIYCREMTSDIEKAVAILRMMDRKLTGIYEGEIYLLDPDKVLYIDTADKKTFIYTENKIYDTNLKLYELEEQLSGVGFFRGGKSCIINLRHIESLRMDLERRIRVTMDNGEKLLVSRQYADELKRRLGVK